MSEVLYKILIVGSIFIFGTAVFSFLNVLIYRIPKGITFGKKRSFCTSCGHELRWYDMFPILSYILLLGRCRYCKSHYSARYAIVELLGGVSAVTVFYHYFQTEEYFSSLHITGAMAKGIVMAIFAFIFIAMLTVVAYIDIDTMEISDKASIMAAIMGVIGIFVFDDVTVLEHIIGFFAASVPLLVFTMIIPDAFGGGDIKLMFGIGGLLGWKNCLLCLFIAVVMGGIQGALAMAVGKKSRKDHFAFGPHLSIGAVIALLWGRDILNWYFSFY